VLAEVLPAQHLIRVLTGAAKPCRSKGVREGRYGSTRQVVPVASPRCSMWAARQP
jgi:hypothetical protein